jgi:hypothetical protein
LPPSANAETDESGEIDQTLAVETMALFVRHWLTVTPPVPSDQQAAARAKGRERYEGFVDALVRRMAGATRLSLEVTRDAAASAERTEEDLPTRS